MAINKVTFLDDVLIDLTNDTVTSETLAKGVTAHAKNGEIITGTMESGNAKIGETTITKNGIYEASVDGITGVVTEVYNANVPFTIDLTETLGVPIVFWKTGVALPSNFEYFKNNTYMKVTNSDGSVLAESSFSEMSWDGVEGVVLMSDSIFIIYDPAAFEEQMLGGSLGLFETGIYIAGTDIVNENFELTLTAVSTVPADAYNKVIVDVPNGNLNWITVDNIHYAINNNDLIVVGNGETPHDAFRELDIERAFIGQGIEQIGNSAFYKCANLKHVYMPDSLINFGDYIFEKCTGIETFVIPDGVERLPLGMFDECTSLKSITIPDSVGSIGMFVCRDCTSLTDIIFKGTVSQWLTVNNGRERNWIENCPVTYVQCSDGNCDFFN